MDEQLYFGYCPPIKAKNKEEEAMREISRDSFREIMFHLKEIMQLAKWVNMEDINA